MLLGFDTFAYLRTLAGSPHNFGSVFEMFMQEAVIARAAGTAVPGSAPPSPLQTAAQEIALTPPPRRTQMEDLSDHIEQLAQATTAWTAQLEERMRLADARLEAFATGVPWSRGRSSPAAAHGSAPPPVPGLTATAP